MADGFKVPENFSMHFPQGISAKDKALLLGTLFLVNYMYYEDYASGSHHKLYSVPNTDKK